MSDLVTGATEPQDGGSARTIRVVITDDHAVVRRGLQQVLDAEESVEVVAEASDLDGARRYVLGYRPDVLVLDLNLPGGLSLTAIPGLRDQFPDTQIVVLMMQNEPAYAREALSSGALVRLGILAQLVQSGTNRRGRDAPQSASMSASSRVGLEHHARVNTVARL